MQKSLKKVVGRGCGNFNNWERGNYRCWDQGNFIQKEENSQLRKR